MDDVNRIRSEGDSAVDGVVARLKLMMTSRGLVEGDRLPPERQLAAEMGVSRSTIREALGTLSRMGIVEVKRGSGAFVRDAASQSLLQGMAFMIEVSPIEMLLDFLTLRRIVEAEAAMLAAVRITDDELAELEECLAQMSAMADEDGDHTEDDVAADIRFHGILNAASRNPALETLGSALSTMTFRLRVTAGMYRSDESMLGTRREHEAIFTAVKDRDPSRAAAVAAAHVAAVERTLRAALAS